MMMSERVRPNKQSYPQTTKPGEFLGEVIYRRAHFSGRGSGSLIIWNWFNERARHYRARKRIEKLNKELKDAKQTIANLQEEIEYDKYWHWGR